MPCILPPQIVGRSSSGLVHTNPDIWPQESEAPHPSCPVPQGLGTSPRGQDARPPAPPPSARPFQPPVWYFPSFSPSCSLPFSPPHHTLPGSGPGGRVNKAPTATPQALPIPHQLRRCRYATQCWPTGTHRALGGHVCSLEQPPPARTTEPTQSVPRNCHAMSPAG